MIYAISAVVLLILVYLFFLMGRRNNPMIKKLRGWKYAHRGLHNAERPENSMAAFRAALEKGYGIELDVHLMKDGNLAVIHDASLQRVAGADVKIEDLTLEDLENYRLGGTEERIPLFREVLELFDGKAPIIVEVKCERDNFARLCQATTDMLENYRGDYCMESFDPRAVRWLYKNKPSVCRGQLTQNWLITKAKLPWILKFVLTFHLSNVYSRPDFLAVMYEDRKTFGTGLCRKLLGIQGVSWTIRSQQACDTAEAEGWLPIFENFEP